MTKRARSMLITCVILASLFTGTCIFLYMNHQMETQYIEGSIPRGYSSLNELAADSDIIAVVKVNKKLNHWVSDHLPAFNLEATILTPIFQSKHGETIIITQIGGVMELEGKKINRQLKDDPPMDVGKEYLIFARHNDIDTYTIIGGPQGKFLHSNGSVSSLHAIDRSLKKYGQIELHSFDINQVKSQLSSYLSVAP